MYGTIHVTFFLGKRFMLRKILFFNLFPKKNNTIF